jgi:hypothetical protein
VSEEANREQTPELALLLKSYLPDLPYAERLVESLHRFNTDRLPMFIVVPADEVPSFAHLSGDGISVLSEDLLGEHLTAEPIAGFSPGYMNQQIVKLAFWELGLAANYLCMDSDAVFLRPFGRADFMAAPGVPYSFLTEDAELVSEPEYYREHWAVREPKLRRIQLEVGLDSDRLLTCHQHAVFSSAVLRSYRDSYLRPRGMDYADALAISPYEFSWYNMWLQKDRTIPIIMREPVFKTFHNASQHLEYLLRGVTNEDVARGYLGLVINSNYSRGAGVVSMDDARYESLASYVPVSDLLRAAAYGTWWRATGRGHPISALRTRVGALLGRGPKANA